MGFTLFLLALALLCLMRTTRPLRLQIEHNNITIRGKKLMALINLDTEHKVKLTAVPNTGGYDSESFSAVVTEGDAVLAVEAIAGEPLSVYAIPLQVGQAIVTVSLTSTNGTVLTATAEFDVQDVAATELTIDVGVPEPL